MLALLRIWSLVGPFGNHKLLPLGIWIYILIFSQNNCVVVQIVDSLEYIKAMLIPHLFTCSISHL